jgi:hypothetical protein
VYFSLIHIGQQGPVLASHWLADFSEVRQRQRKLSNSLNIQLFSLVNATQLVIGNGSQK